MKATNFILPCLIGMACWSVSCTQDKEQSKKSILLSVDEFIPDEEVTKTTCDPADGFTITWASGDVIGIFPKEGYQEPFAIPASQVGNVYAMFDGGYWDIKDGLQYGAYYPFDVENFKTAEEKTHIPVDYSGQQQTGKTCGLGAYDYTYSDWQTAKNGSASFQFHHIGAFVEFSLVLPATATYTKLEATVSSKLIPQKGSYDMTADPVAFVADESTKTSTMQVTLNEYNGTAVETALIYMMLPPVDLSESIIQLTLTTSAETKCTYTANKKKNFKAGYYYRINGNPVESNIAGSVDDWQNQHNGHAYVDLGLTSGTLWATCNVGSLTPEGYGNYYFWGETSENTNGKTDNDWSVYKWCDGTETTMTKYCTSNTFGSIDNKSELESSDDAAQVNWGGSWRTPSKTQQDELRTECNWTAVTQNGVYGSKVTSKKNGNSIFLPYAGWSNGSSHYRSGSRGYYWSRSLHENYSCNAYSLGAEGNDINWWYNYRCSGFSVRPVCEKPMHNGHEYVDLGLTSGTKWATCNVGADKPEDYGDYFAWGEITVYNSGKTNFDWSTYIYCNGSQNTMTKYCINSLFGTVDNKTELELIDDAAHVNWGGNWVIPSSEQIDELLNECNTEWTTQSGVYGRKFTSKKNNNHIFLPANGCRNSSSFAVVGTYGHYWSCSLRPADDCNSSSYYLSFGSNLVGRDSYIRSQGRGIRPVFSE